jgi:SNF2 family DNA or RNA helicase
MGLRIPSLAQQRALNYALPKARIALFMEMRLGKSLVAIRWAQHHKLQRILVVAPNDILLDWAIELSKEHISTIQVTVLEGTGLNKLAVAEEIDHGWVIVNYEAIRQARRSKRVGIQAGTGILKLPWDGIILDESTAIRTPNSVTTKTLLKFSGHIPYRCIMTGLPNPNSELDYFSQMLFLNGSFLGFYNFWSYRDALYYPDPMGWTWTPKSTTTPRVRAEVHKLAFILSRKDAGVGTHAVRERRYVTMMPRQRIAYTAIERDFSYKETKTVFAPVRELWLARLAGGFLPVQPRCVNCTALPVQCEECKVKNSLEYLNPGKADSIVHLAKTELKKEQLVVWFRFNAELDAVATALEKQRIAFHMVKGGSPDTAAKELIQKKKQEFQSGNVQIMLMQQMMGKYGWDLSASSTAIYYSNVYDWEARAQSQDRIVNVRKQDTLLYIDLVTKNTVDEDIVDVLTDRRVTAQLFNGRFKERVLDSLRQRYPPPRQPIPLVQRILPGDSY